jgi:APA family basic amino acid/polyamine antiporter
VDYVVFADWIFFGLTGGSLLIFRRRVPLATRPSAVFRMPGVPLLPGLFVLAAAAVVLSLVWANPGGSALGALLLLAGIPVFAYWRRRTRAETGNERSGTRSE